ncbi:preQ(1) synthase [Caldanaerobius polysaccharolyticus]|uniref:preQ(1) synthase n=1 Tax=Caldanaerobius polysaccharolyticus TaxID=44256 RepID=UPI00047B4576|nr:preQ(1) synthase [Caldanaerobius polysaccharolyticus]
MPKYDKRWDVDGYEAIDTKILESIPFEYPGSNTEVEYIDPEFTSVCPWTGLPDFGTITIKYIPSDRLVELKSLKYYLNSFRNVGILQEHVVNRILNDLKDLLDPIEMTVKGVFNARGGISTVVTANYKKDI